MGIKAFRALAVSGFSTMLAFAAHSADYAAGGFTLETAEIPAGSFVMGHEHGDPDELPLREVHLDAFELGTCEVTVAQFRAFAIETGYEGGSLEWLSPGYEQSPNEPALNVSWHDAMAFCAWLSAQTGGHFRLPTEAEWEYAAMAGARPPASRYERMCLINRLDEHGWNRDNSARTVTPEAWRRVWGNPPSRKPAAHPAASKIPNAWGLFDMAGNAREWTLDIYHCKHNAPADGAPNLRDGLPPIAGRRVLKGGSYKSESAAVYPAFRERASPDARENDIGFRVAKGKPVPMEEDEPAREFRPLENDALVWDPLSIELIAIQPGRFVLGGSYSPAPTWFKRIPEREVRIARGFRIGMYEITKSQFRAFAEDAGYITDAEKERRAMWMNEEGRWTRADRIDWRNLPFPNGDNHPASCVSWRDAMHFCNWLSDKTGHHVDLPSMAEWEYACRAGSTGDFEREDRIDGLGWFQPHAPRGTMPAGTREPNAWGIHDMRGNVWE